MPCKNMSHHQASQKHVDESPSTMVGWPASKPHCSSEASAEERRAREVLGWDVDQLPTIVLKGEPLRQSMAKSGILAGEPEINADCGHEGANFPQTETVHGNVSVSASREDSVIHHKSCVRNSSKGGIVNQHVKDLEKDHIKANKLRVLDSKLPNHLHSLNYSIQNMISTSKSPTTTELANSNILYKKQNCLNQRRKQIHVEDRRGSEGGSSCKKKRLCMKSYLSAGTEYRWKR
ncbi:hypothetical protein OIU85_002411 [Salix viminalis]|uniref:Uncharacterized protein n=1 Tax=Salix viminalis TaxID=40686 RepID=A0A9Q0VQU6_SALVM|nr:hypothetical protein OIU85_002411 [Salix viminalis]